MKASRLFTLALTAALALGVFALALTATAVEEAPRVPASIGLTVTVGTTSGACAATESISVLAGTDVYFCYTVTNTGGVTLPLHSLSDDQFDLQFLDVAYDLGPGDSLAVDSSSTLLATVPTLEATEDTTLNAIWTARTQDNSVVQTASGTASITIIPDLEMTKTVGTTPGVCATTDEIVVASGTVVYYCYTVTNNTMTTKTVHTLQDSDLGMILTGVAADLGPGQTVSTLDLGETVSKTVFFDTVNTATWTASGMGAPIEATDSASVVVAAPSIVLTKTVGLEPDVCATEDSAEVPPAGGVVYYCYTVQNTGNITLPLHDLVDSELGTLLDDFAFDLGPGAAVDTVAAGLVVSDFIDAPTTNTATWTAFDTELGSADAMASASVTVAPIETAVVLTKTVGTDPDVCATTSTIQTEPGTTVYYCYTVENTGNFVVNLHTLEDSAFGLLFDGLPLPLQPGDSINTVAIDGLTFSQTLTTTTVNTATWTAYNPGPVDAATATATATVDVAYRAYLPAIFRP